MPNRVSWISCVVSVIIQTAMPVAQPKNAARTTSHTSSARASARRTCGACMTAEPIGRRGRRVCGRLLVELSLAADASSPARLPLCGPASVESPGGGGIQDVQPRKKEETDVFCDRIRPHATIHL